MVLKRLQTQAETNLDAEFFSFFNHDLVKIWAQRANRCRHILTTGVWEGGGTSSALTAQAFSTGLPGTWGGVIVAIALIFFAYSTVLGWAYYGERNVERLIGVKGVLPYRIIFSIIVFFGATMKLEVVWNFSDAMNGLMAIPNLIGLLICSGLIARETKAYLAVDPTLQNEPAVSTLHGIEELSKLPRVR